MSNEKIYLSREEQIFLMEMLEMTNPLEAVDKFALMLVEGGADPTKLQQYIKKIMSKMK